VHLYIHNNYTHYTHIYYVHKLLFWMRLMAIHRFTALILTKYTTTYLQHRNIYFERQLKEFKPTILTGLMSRCKKPTEWMLSMASSICRQSLSVVLTVKVPRFMLLLRSAKLRPCKSQKGNS